MRRELYSLSLSFILIFCTLFLVNGNKLIGQNRYSVELIPDSLLENANVVVRTDEGVVNVINKEKGTFYTCYAVTIFNKNGKKWNKLRVPYDTEFKKVEEISGTLYDQDGRVIRKLKNKEIEDYSGSGNDVTDSRMKFAEMNHSEYPYTVEYITETTYKGSIYFPDWYFQPSAHASIQNSVFKVITPLDFSWNYKLSHGAPEPTVTENPEARVYQWVLSNLVAWEREKYSPPMESPTIHSCPELFVMDDYRGDASSWEGLGQFMHELNEGRQELPKELKEKVNQLTQGISDPLEKIDVLYKYMQEHTRYVSIQLGIGGWQTFDPEYVYNNGYGDCKALTNYLHSMLKEVEVTSFPALVRAGDYAPDILTDFPSSQFNHVILAVPVDGDTVWVECTAKDNPAGYLGQFTQDRHVLLYKDGGSKVVKTPVAYPNDNLQDRKAEITLNADGTAEAEVTTRFKGFQQDDIRLRVSRLNDREMEDWIKEGINIPSYDLKEYTLNEVKGQRLPIYDLDYQVFARKWASASGSRLFLAPNTLNPKINVPEKMDDRTQPIALRYPYLDTDTLTYHLPEGYSIESMPEMPVKIETVFGEYEANIVMKDPSTLVYSRKLKMEKIELPAKSYNAFREFRKAVSKADRLQIVLNGKS